MVWIPTSDVVYLQRIFHEENIFLVLCIKMIVRATSFKKSCKASQTYDIFWFEVYESPPQPLTIRPICTPIEGSKVIKR